MSKLCSPKLIASIKVAFILGLFIIFTGCSTQPENQQSSSTNQTTNNQNIILIVADDHSPDLGAYGNPVIQTPHLDQLAKEGTRFNFAYATTASCSASRSVILSGLHNHRNGHYGHQHDHFRSFSNLKTLPVLLGEAGYRTASVGKYHVAPEEVYHFQEYIEAGNRNPVEMANNSSHVINSDSDKPFFLYFCTSDPHRGGGTADELPHAPNRFGNNPDGYEGIEPVKYDPEEVKVPAFLPDNPTTRAEIAQYYQSISRIDQGVGHLINMLKEAGEYENSLIIYTSDHGMAFPGAKTNTYEPALNIPFIVRSPNVEKRGVVSNAMISMTDLTPALLDFAGVEQPTYEYDEHINDPGISENEGKTHQLHGTSFLSILEEENPEGWNQIFASHTFHELQMYYPMRVVRDREYKLIWNVAHELPYPFASDLWAAPTWQNVYQKGNTGNENPQFGGNMDARFGVRTVGEYIHRPEFELYDMQKDSIESQNLAGDPEYADVLAEYKDKIKAFQRRTSDPWFTKWQYE